jgi:crotonobetainyl-CoA:carnitine CoA-transferase CaiB-like acyl-CoA transferase
MLPTAPPRNADGNYVVLPTSDGYIRVLPAGQRHWRGLVELLGRAEVFAGPEWDLALYRMINADAIRAVAAETLRDRSAPRSSPKPSRAACRSPRSTRRMNLRGASRPGRAAIFAARGSRTSAMPRSLLRRSCSRARRWRSAIRRRNCVTIKQCGVRRSVRAARTNLQAPMRHSAPRRCRSPATAP